MQLSGSRSRKALCLQVSRRRAVLKSRQLVTFFVCKAAG